MTFAVVMTALERLMAKTHKSANCWQWQGCKTPRGYGYMWFKGRVQPAHRISYELHVSPIPEGLVIDHLCHNTSCINPNHLEPVTQKENLRRDREYRRDRDAALARGEAIQKDVI